MHKVTREREPFALHDPGRLHASVSRLDVTLLVCNDCFLHRSIFPSDGMDGHMGEIGSRVFPCCS